MRTSDKSGKLTSFARLDDSIRLFEELTELFGRIEALQAEKGRAFLDKILLAASGQLL